VLAVTAASCGTSSETPGGPIVISLHPSQDQRPAYIEVTGLSSAETSGLRDREASDPAWQDLLRVTVGVDQADDSMPAVQGRYVGSDGVIRFTPLFPFDAGRSYRVKFDPARLPKPRQEAAVTSVVGFPPVATEPTTVVTAIHPAAAVVPENLLRIYVEFSAPMGSGVGLNFVRLLEKSADGKQETVVQGPFLPVEANFWNPDHTRYTLFFDPGRVKEGIFPNRTMGRPLKAGRSYVLEVLPAWTDANGLPLKAVYRHEFSAGPLIDEAIRTADWKVTAPKSGTRDPLIVTFPRALDHAIIVRALSVETADGRAVPGDVVFDTGDTRWAFTPGSAWIGGAHNIVAQSFLEDSEGNRIDQAFEVYENSSYEPAPETFRIAFKIP
jgi:hypothetical protein